jgi:hypothetical protein
LLAGALAGLAGGGGVCGAAPVVTPGPVFGRGVTSRIPGGAAGGEVGPVFWAVVGAGFWAVEVVPLWRIDELLNP